MLQRLLGAAAFAALIAGLVLAQGATAAGIAEKITAAGDALNVDNANGVTPADGIMIARYFLGVTSGDALTAGQSNTPPSTVAQNIQATLPL